MNALELLISDYLSANNHLASDGYANGDADKIVEAARAQQAELLAALERIVKVRDEIADHGEPQFGDGPGDGEEFDDWAANIASRAIAKATP